MAISPFHNRSSSQEIPSRDVQRKPSNLSPSQQQRLMDASPKLPSGLSKSSTIRSISSQVSNNSTSLAKQYETDRQNLIKYCFSVYDNNGHLVDNYITHVRIIEDSMYASTRPPTTSASENKKQRILALAAKPDGTVYLHKGRENSNGTFQIGRTWSLNDLVSIERDLKFETGFACCLGKDYYWETNSPRERQVFIGSLIRTYRKFKQGLLPILLNWDLATFGLDEESYKLFLNKELIKKVATSSPKKKKAEISSVPPVSESSRIPSPEKPQNRTSKSNDPYPIKPQIISKSNISKEKVDIQSSPQRPISNKTSAGSTPEPQTVRPNKSSSDFKKQPSPHPTMRQTSLLIPQGSRLSPRLPEYQQRHTSPSSPYQQFKQASSPSLNQGKPTITRSRSMLLDNEDDFPPTAPKSASPVLQQTLIIEDEEPIEKPKQAEPSRRSLDPKLTPPPIAAGADTVPYRGSNKSSSVDLNEDYQPDVSNNGISRVSTSAKDIEIFAHSKSSREKHDSKAQNDYEDYEEEEPEPTKESEIEPMHYDYQDDITDLYDDTVDEDEMESSIANTDHIELPKLQIPHVIQLPNQAEITPLEQSPAFEDDAASEFSYGESQVGIDTRQQIPPSAVKTVHLYNNGSSSVLDSFDDASSPTDTMLPLHLQERSNELQGQRFRANSLASLDSGLPKETSQESEYDDIFDQINWDPSDDSSAIVEKLQAELNNVEYETTRSLIKISENNQNRKSSYQRILKECERLTPIFDYFSVELSGFVYDIKDVEFEGKGLQVETSNKKKLWNDLQNLLNTISVDEQSLNFLLNANIDDDTVNIESILSELESAILAIRGDKNKEEDVAEMKALRERGETYENFFKLFLSSVKRELDKRFKRILNDLSKVENATHDVLKTELSKLMVYSGITLFIKNISKDALSDLSLVWQNDINPYYLNQLSLFGNKIADLTAQGNQLEAAAHVKYSLINAPKPSFSKSPSPTVRASTEDSSLRHQLGLSDETQFNETTSQTLLYQNIVSVLKYLELNIGTQQEFLFKFFHMNNEDLKMAQFREKFPILSRDKMLIHSGKDIDEVDTNRALAREVYHSIHHIFQPHLDKFVKLIAHTLKYHENYTPLVLTHLQITRLRLNSSDQEFTSNILMKLEEKLTNDWLRFVDFEIGLIEKNTLAHKKIVEVSNIVKNFTRLIEDIDTNFKAVISDCEGTVDLEKLHVRDLINNSNAQFTRALLANLQHELKSLTNNSSGNNGEVHHHVTKASQSYDINEVVDDGKFKYNQIVNIVQNSNYLLDTITALRLPQFNDFLNSVREIFNKSRDIYIGTLMESVPEFNKIVNFVKDVEEYLKETHRTSDPSKRNAYTKQTLDKLLHGIDVKYINNMISQLRQDINQDVFIKTSDNDTNSKLYQKSLIDKIWSSLQAEYVGVFIILESMVEKYYKEVGLKFNKRDLINAFNNARISGKVYTDI